MPTATEHPKSILGGGGVKYTDIQDQSNLKPHISEVHVDNHFNILN